MPLFLLILSFLLAALDWLAVTRNIRRLKLWTKPAVMVALIAWLWAAGGWVEPLPLFGLALVFSLAGDVLLMMPPRWFIWGLFSFLAAHIVYLAAFNPSQPPLIPMIVLLVIAGALMISILPRLLRNIRIKPGARRLRVATAFYSVFLTLMAISAVLTLFRPEWKPAAAALAASGGLLFFTSDNLLAYDRFVKPVRYGRLMVRISYHLGQIALIAAAVVQYVQ